MKTAALAALVAVTLAGPALADGPPFPLTSPAKFDLVGRFNGLNIYSERAYRELGGGVAWFNLVYKGTTDTLTTVATIEVNCATGRARQISRGAGIDKAEINQQTFWTFNPPSLPINRTSAMSIRAEQVCVALLAN